MGIAICSSVDCHQRSVARTLCRAHYQEAWKAGDFETLPARAPGPTICPDDHKHDANTVCYIRHRCRCAACRSAHTLLEQKRRKLKAYGRWDTGLVDVAPVREHLLALSQFGLGYKRVSHLAGVSTTITQTIIWGRAGSDRHGTLQKLVKRETAEAILAVRPDIEHLPDGAYIPSTGTQRRIQALCAKGWSMSKQAQLVGMYPTNLGRILTRELTTKAMYLRVKGLYEELWDQDPPQEHYRDKISVSRTLTAARSAGWLSAYAWDDIDFDAEPPALDADAEVELDEIAIELACDGVQVRLTPGERRAAIRILHGRQLSDSEIARRLHIADRSAFRIRSELQLPAVIAA